MSTDDTKLKELVKAALVEVLEERRDLVQVVGRSSYPVNQTVKTVVFWIALLLTAILLFQIVQHN